MKRKFLYYMLIMLLAIGAISQAKCDEKPEIDPSPGLKGYLKATKKLQNKPIVLKMCDTLIQRGEKEGVPRICLIALGYKLDYYANINKMDSVKHYSKVMREYAQKVDLPEYFSFAWARVVYVHMFASRWFSGLQEAQKMQEYAIKHKDNQTLVTAMSLIGTIYLELELYDKALEAFNSIIKIIEHNKVEDFNAYLHYVQAATCNSKMGRFSQALNLFKLAEKKIIQKPQLLQVYQSYIGLYLEMKDYKSAKKYFDLSADLMKEVGYRDWYNMEYSNYLAEYYVAIGDKAKLQSIIEDSDNTFKMLTPFSIAEIYNTLGNYKEASRYYEQHINTLDSNKRQTNASLMLDIMACMDVDRLEFQNQELELDVQHRNMQLLVGGLAAVTIILLVVLLLYLRISRMNKNLISASQDLAEKNANLEQAREELAEQNNQLEKTKNELFRNNTALLKAKEELLDALAKAEAANRLKTAFIQNLSHEIRTPMNAIVGYSQLLSEIFGTDKEIKPYTEPIMKGVDNLLKMITDIVTMSMFDSNTYKSEEISYSLNEMLNHCVDQVKDRIENEVKLTVLNLEKDLKLDNDKFALENIIVNTLLNAAKFTRNGFINLECKNNLALGQLEIQITDSGVGIPDEFSEKVFERYFKVDSFSQGLGVGLDLARRFAILLGGEYHLDKNYKSGTKFIFTMPLDTKK